ncbi:MAG: TonB-dependent receptor [Bacteroidales bacterium]|jgi:iron complex outermembrane receptor protein|nr:TonB-dependent receptor [Bacteroidales bacterium]
MRRVFLIVVIMFLGAIGAVAQSLTGIVRDENQEPLPGVNIEIVDAYSGTFSNVSGEYSIRLKSGKYQVKFSFIGYEPLIKAFQIASKDVEMNVQLTRKAHVTEDVLVQSTRVGERASTSYDDIGGEELKRNNMGRDIPYLLQLSPSVVATSETGTGIGYSSFRIRGTDPTRVNVTIDGIPYNDAESQGTYFVNMPDFANSVSSVQIQRGIGTSTNGAGAFGASMNFKTKALNAKPYAEFEALGGSFNTLKATAMAGTGLINKHFTMDARFSRVLSDGWIERAFVDHESFQLSAAYRGENDLLKASIIRGNQTTGITWWGVPQDSLNSENPNRQFNPAGLYLDADGNLKAYPGQTDNYKQTHYHLHYTHVVSNKLNFNVSGHYTRGDGYYEQYFDVDYENTYGFGDLQNMSFAYYQLPDVMIGDTTIQHTDLVRRKWMGNDFYGAIASVNYNAGRFDASFGGGWNRYDGDHFGRLIWMRYAGDTDKGHEYYFNNGTKDDANAYAKLNYLINENLSTFGDLQYRHINYSLTGDSDDLMPDGSQTDLTQTHQFDFFNPKTGVHYVISDRMATYASFAMGHREPTRTHFKDAAGDPNKTPKAEQMLDYEFGYKYQANKLALSVNFYYMDYTDQLVPTGEKSAVGYDIMTNVEDSYRAGIEMMAGIKAFDFLDWNANLTLSQNKIRNFTYWASYYDADWNETYEPRTLSETDIAYSPSVVGSSKLSFHIFQGLDVSLISKYVGKQYFDNTSSENRMLDAYFVNDLELFYQFSTKIIPKIELRLQVNNIFNEVYSSDAYGGLWFETEDGALTEKTWAYYFPQAGTNIFGAIRLYF